jgi:alpha-N-arabinofuranosidase
VTTPNTPLSLTLHSDQPGGRIPRELYGHFAEHLGRCIYDGIWVGEDSDIPNTRGLRNDVLAALKELDIPVLRWPGGCFADEYHWRDGVGPRDERQPMVNNHWGGVIDPNQFGTHEFMDLVAELGCDAYIAGNVGSGTVQEMQEWVEYLTADVDSTMVKLRRANGREKPWRVRFFGVGNENWVCGGHMRPEFYADEYRRYQTYVRHHDPENRIFRIACGPNSDDYNWTEVLMERAAEHMDGLSLHYYCLPTNDWNDKGPALGFPEDDWFIMFQRAWHMDELITKHSAIMDRHDPEKRIALIVDEWGSWYNTEPGTNPRFLFQQNTLRDALLAALHLHIFHRHRERVRMANIAQTVNVLQSMVLTDGPRMLRTPTHHAMVMLKGHQDAEFLPVDLSPAPEYTRGDASVPAVDVSASRRADGVITLSAINCDPERGHDIELHLPADDASRTLQGRQLTADTLDAHNTFDEPDRLTPVDLPAQDCPAGEPVRLSLPARSVTVYTLT